MKPLLQLAQTFTNSLSTENPAAWQVWLLRLTLLCCMTAAGVLAGGVLAFLVFGFTAGPERTAIPAVVVFLTCSVGGFLYGSYLAFLKMRR